MSKERPRQVPAERFAAPWLDFDLHAATAELRAEPSPSRQGHKQRTLFKHGRRTIALFVMDAGASLPEHSTAGTVTILVIDGELTVTMAGEQTSGVEIVQAGRDLNRSVAETAGRIVSDGRVGFEAAHVTVSRYETLARAMTGGTLVPTTGIVESRRLVKDAEEIALMTEAARIADLAFAACADGIFRGWPRACNWRPVAPTLPARDRPFWPPVTKPNSRRNSARSRSFRTPPSPNSARSSHLAPTNRPSRRCRKTSRTSTTR